MKRVITKGLFIKDRIEYDEKRISYIHRKLQFPFDLFNFEWIGFIKHEEHEFDFDKCIYFVNSGKILRRKTIYISETDDYDFLPTSKEEMALDDQDDLTLSKYVESGAYERSKLSTDDLENDLDADYYMYTDTLQLRIGKYTSELLGILETSSATKANFCKVGRFVSINQQCLAYTNTWAYHVKPYFWGDSEIDSTPINYMAFFLKTRSLFSNGGLYCGYHRQILINSIKSTDRDAFHSWCKTYAPRLTEKGIIIKSTIWANPLNIWRWIHPDIITLTDKAVLYTRKTFRKDEMTYLPYERINFLLSKGGLLFKRFDIYGEQNILPLFSFSRLKYREIKKIIQDNGVKTSYGKSYHSTYLYPKNWFGRAPRIIIVDNQMIYYPNRLKKDVEKIGNIEEKDKNQRHAVIECNNINNVTWYKRLLTWIGDIKIEGTPSNIRLDQEQKEATIIIPNLWMFSYHYFFFFKGSLKRFLDYSSSASYERRYKGSWNEEDKD